MQITLTLEDKSDWVKIFNPSDRTVFVACDSPPEIRSVLRLDLIIPDGPKTIFRGKVIARRLQGDDNFPKGCRIALSSEEREKINYLNGYVRGGLLDWRKKRRIAIKLAVHYTEGDTKVDTFTRDINEEGVFVVTESPLAEQTELKLYIEIPGRSEPFPLSGKVVHTVVVEDEDVPGMGICFALERSDSILFSKEIDKLEAAFLSGKISDKLLE